MNLSIIQASIVIDELICGGVSEIVLCPGSRNAPLAFAAYKADINKQLRLHVRIDERTAGYLAIGLAIKSCTPVCIAMTSGTAVANIGPSIAEANYAQVPLVVLSANRPYELLGTGANQTFEQFGYFGTQMRSNISLGLAESHLEKLKFLNAKWRSAVCRALDASIGSRTNVAGPVQLDIPLSEPLLPNTSYSSTIFPAGRNYIYNKSWTYNSKIKLKQLLKLDLTLNTIVISGHCATKHTNLSNLPTISEPYTSFSKNPLHPLALHLLCPKQIVILGRPTLHRTVSMLLANSNIFVYELNANPEWIRISENSVANGICALVVGKPNSEWLKHCLTLNLHILIKVRKQVSRNFFTTGLHVAAVICDSLKPGDQVLLGASNAVRDISLVGISVNSVRIFSNRGISGIDGAISTSIGVSLAYNNNDCYKNNNRTIALVGDLTFFHDNSGLLIGPKEPKPNNLTIVVSNDNGGGIFELLEQGNPQFSNISSRIFTTPHNMNVISLCSAYQIESEKLSINKLSTVLDSLFYGVRVLEIKSDRFSLRALHEKIINSI